MTLLQRRVTARQLCDHLRTTTGTLLSDQTVRNRLQANNLRPRRPVVCTPLLQRHRTTKSTSHVRWQCVQWSLILSSDESRFALQFRDGRERVYRRPGERFTDVKVIQHLVMVVSWFGMAFLSMIRLLFMLLMVTWMEITICRRLFSCLSYLCTNVLVRRPCFKMTTPYLIVQDVLRTFLADTLSTGWIGHRIRQVCTPLSVHGTSWDVNFEVTMPHPPIMHIWPVCLWQSGRQYHRFPSKTGEQHEMEVCWVHQCKRRLYTL